MLEKGCFAFNTQAIKAIQKLNKVIVQVLGSSLDSELGFLSQINNNNLLKILVNYIESVCFLESGISSFYSNSQVHRINLHATLR